MAITPKKHGKRYRLRLHVPKSQRKGFGSSVLNVPIGDPMNEREIARAVRSGRETIRLRSRPQDVDRDNAEVIRKGIKAERRTPRTDTMEIDGVEYEYITTAHEDYAEEIACATERRMKKSLGPDLATEYARRYYDKAMGLTSIESASAEWLSQVNISDETRVRYARMIGQFCAWYRHHYQRDNVALVTRQVVIRFLRSRDVPKPITTALAALRGLWNWLVREGEADLNPWVSPGS